MQVSQIPILKFLKTANSLVIPVYQRDYAWKTENCKKLWDDLNEVFLDKRPNHFLGTLVTINNGLGKYLVIDGQQRLTTITLFVLGLIHHLEKKEEKSEAEQQLQKVLKSFIIDDESLSLESRIKLKPNKTDNYYFQEVFQKNITKDPESNIIQNYQFFRNIFEENHLDFPKIFEGLQKLNIVSIDLVAGQDDPQLIFESLNSTGVDLTDGDLIRNYILMDLDPQIQEKLYLQYWVKIEHAVANVAEFVRNFLMFKLQKNVTQTKRAVYNEFKNYSEDKFEKDSQKILETLIEYANIYSYLVRMNNHPDNIIDQNLQRIYDLEFTVAHPFLFEVFDLHRQGILSSETVAKVVHLIESYAFRKILVYNSTQGLNKFFLTLGKEIKKLEPDNWQEKFFDIASFIIKSKGGSQKFPTDEEFVETLQSKEIYKLRSKNRDFLLKSLENYNSSYKVDISDLTIEHIMPQTLDSRWKESLGEDWQNIHTNYLHTLGNLTLTANNSKLSNNDFETKKEIDLHTSKLKLNYQLSDVDDWNEKTILNRSKKLAEEALEIWQYPETDFEQIIENGDVYVLDENLDLRNTKPKTIFINEEEIKIDHWWEVKKILSQKFQKESPTLFKEIMNNSEIARYFATQKENNLLSPFEFSKDYFVDIHGSTFDVFRFSIKLCELFNYDFSEISFEISSSA